MNYTGPLTTPLLYERTAELFKRCVAEGGDPEEILFEILYCDGCRRTLNRLVETPIGWTTSGSLRDGWRDLCAACTHKESET